VGLWFRIAYQPQESSRIGRHLVSRGKLSRPDYEAINRFVSVGKVCHWLIWDYSTRVSLTRVPCGFGYINRSVRYSGLVLQARGYTMRFHQRRRLRGRTAMWVCSNHRLRILESGRSRWPITGATGVWLEREEGWNSTLKTLMGDGGEWSIPLGTIFLKQVVGCGDLFRTETALNVCNAYFTKILPYLARFVRRGW